MAGTALRERTIVHPPVDESPAVLGCPTAAPVTDGETLAFSALLREVLGDLRKDPAFLALKGSAEASAASLEPAA